MKAHTDLEQSKKLAEILPLESIDMFCADVCIKEEHSYNFHILSTWGYNTFEEAKEYENNYVHFTPCWSLAALLNLLPSEITYFETTYEIRIRKYALTKDVDIHQIAYGNIKFDVDGQFSFKDMINTGEKENLVDACVQMIFKLKDLKLLK